MFERGLLCHASWRLEQLSKPAGLLAGKGKAVAVLQGIADESYCFLHLLGSGSGLWLVAPGPGALN